MREVGQAFADGIIDRIREWIAVLGALGGGLGAGLLLYEGKAGSVPGVVCLVLAVGALVAAVFGLRDRDIGAWAAAVIAVIVGIAAFVMFTLASQV